MGDFCCQFSGYLVYFICHIISTWLQIFLPNCSCSHIFWKKAATILKIRYLVAQRFQGWWQCIIQVMDPCWCVMTTQGVRHFWDRLLLIHRSNIMVTLTGSIGWTRALHFGMWIQRHLQLGQLPPGPLADKWDWMRTIVVFNNLWPIGYSFQHWLSHSDMLSHTPQ